MHAQHSYAPTTLSGAADGPSVAAARRGIAPQIIHQCHRRQPACLYFKLLCWMPPGHRQGHPSGGRAGRGACTAATAALLPRLLVGHGCSRLSAGRRYPALDPSSDSYARSGSRRERTSVDKECRRQPGFPPRGRAHQTTGAVAPIVRSLHPRSWAHSPPAGDQQPASFPLCTRPAQPAREGPLQPSDSPEPAPAAQLPFCAASAAMGSPPGRVGRRRSWPGAPLAAVAEDWHAEQRAEAGRRCAQLVDCCSGLQGQAPSCRRRLGWVPECSQYAQARRYGLHRAGGRVA